MKKFRKLIPALCMLLVSALFVGTSTYAWFSMNTSVTATNMQVTAKSNATYLLISNDETKTGASDTTLTDTATAKYVDESNADKTVYPVTFFAKAGENSKIGEVELKNANNYSAETWVGNNKWFTANNGNSNAVKNDVKNIRLVSEGEDNYMLEYNVWLTLSKDSEAVNDKKIQVTMKNHSVEDAAVKAVVVIGNEHFALAKDNDSGTTTDTITVSNNTVVKATVYVYVDGEETNVYSDYVNGKVQGGKAITGSLNLQFDLVA